MRRSSLFWRVLAFFGSLLIILTGTTYMIQLRLSIIEQNFILAKFDVKNINKIQTISFLLDEVTEEVGDYVSSGSPNIRTRYVKDAAQIENILMDETKNSVDTTMRQLFRDSYQTYSRWRWDYADKLILLGDQRVAGLNIDPARHSIEVNEVQNQYLHQLRQRLKDTAQHLSISHLTQIDTATLHSKILGEFIWLVIFSFAIFALILGIVLTLSITKPIQILKQGTQKIMKGDFSPIVLNRTDELGQLAIDFNNMSSMLGSNYIRLNAYSELVTALNSRAAIRDVEDKSLTLLCQHTASAVGALYLLNNERDVLELVAGYALKKAGNDIKTFHLNEGIPGQCASIMKNIELKDVPDRSDFSIDSGLTEIKPRSIFASPIIFQDRLLGVLILGSTRDFTALDKEIINNSVPQIGVAIANARNFEATQKLSIEIAKKNEELNHKNSELEKAYRVKSDFLASMSHELRTPLNSIIGFSSVLLSSGAEPLTSDQEKAIEKVLRNGKHLLQLINDILDFSKIESGRMSITLETDTVENIIGNSVLTVESMIRQKNLTLRQEVQENLPILNTDVLKIRQILVNLLSNAVKFTEVGEICVTVTSENESMTFAVKDSGIGIERKNFEKIFEEFQQIDSSNTRKYKGTGLGLPISRRLARMLGGDLTVQSEMEKGSTFLLTIPFVYRGEDAQPIKKPVAVKPAPIDELKIISPVPGKIQILCIDDDQDVIDILTSYLTPQGYVVIGANSGDEGIELAQKIKPGLITLDIMMPGKDGWQVLRELKQDPATRDIPVLIHSIIDNKPLALSLGAVDVITKPTDPKQLLLLVGRHCTSKEQFVLIIESDKEFAGNLKETIEKQGYHTRVAQTELDAISILETSTPALILFNVMIAGNNDYLLSQKLQQDDRWRNIPVVILSEKESGQGKWETFNTRFREFMTKQESSPESILNVINRILKK